MNWIEDCPNCDGKVNCYDSKKHLHFSRECSKCGYSDPRTYYDKGDGKAYPLLTEKEAIEQGYLVNCPKCGRYEQAWWMRQASQCFKCNHDERNN